MHKRRMALRTRHHLRANAVSYLALLLALSGTAYSVNGSLPGKNTVGSADIINGAVKSPDVGTNQIRSADVRNDDLVGGGLVGDDIADEVFTDADVADASLGGAQFLNDSVYGEDLSGVIGADVDEASLAKVPAAGSADSAGTGRYAHRRHPDGYEIECDPESTQFIECVAVNPLALSVPGRVLVIATVNAVAWSDEAALGACRLVVNGNPYPTSTTNFDENGEWTKLVRVRDNATLVAVTDVLPAGNHSIVLECNQRPGGEVWYEYSRISTMTLSPN